MKWTSLIAGSPAACAAGVFPHQAVYAICFGGTNMVETSLAELSIARSAMSKASWHILPMLGLGYLIATIDRFNVSFAATRMNADLGFSATVYGFGSGLFFLSYALFEVPSGLCVARFTARRWIARIMISWGLLAAGMMFVRTPFQFYVMRLLLGMAEAGFFPCALYCVSNWFPLAYRGRATSRVYACGGLARMVMGVISGWLLNLDGRAGLRGWQWLFLAEGLPAIILGIVILRFLPHSPAETSWLTEPEREWIERELTREAASAGVPAEHHILTALRNPLVLQLAVVGCLTIGSSVAFLLFLPAILSADTGLDIRHVGYLTSVGGMLDFVGMLACGWYSDRVRERFAIMLAAMLLVAAGFLAMGLSTSPVLSVAGYFAIAFLWPAVTLSNFVICTEVVPPRMAGVAVAAMNTLCQLGAFVGPWLWGISKDRTGTYHLGLMLVPLAFVAAMAVTLNLRHQLRAKLRLSRAAALAGI
jgi:ACS family tartrate transporter-like MFS transporter